MKCVKVHIRRGKVGEDMMVYPGRYNAQEVDRNGLGPTSVNGVGAYSKGIGKGAPEEYCYIILDDALADEYATDPEMEIVDGETADADMESWRVANHESEIIIRDPERVRFVQEKLAQAGVAKASALSAEELAVLKSDDPTPGINKRLRKVAAIVAEAGQKLTPAQVKR